ncbi:hypothetical protein [Sphingobium aquiterrae]|uniref:hypothetical protein n=1 Tax=Sphingobium aquiterrae TaxID=2038656 RepID=UPI003016B095
MLSIPNVMLAIWLALSVCVPLLSVTSWPLVYVAYVALGVSSLVALARGGKMQRFPVLILFKIAFMLLLMIVHNMSQRTVVNLGSVAFADIVIGFFVMTQGHDFGALRRILVRVRMMGLGLIVVGIGLGPVFASMFGLDDPIRDFLTGKRVRIFSQNFGHSALIDFAMLMLIMAVSNIASERRGFRAVMVVLALALLAVAKTSIGYIGVGCVLGVALIEYLPLPSRARNGVHMLAVVAGMFAATTMSDDLIFNLRNFQSGGTLTTAEAPKQDLTAGRALLNSELQSVANDYPVFGAGTDVGLLQDGLIRNGVKMAMSESGLRLAAKYGWLYFAVVLILIASPLMALRLRDRPVRIFCIALSLYLLDVFAFNSLFEVAHDGRYIWMLPLVIFVGSYCFHAGRKWTPRAITFQPVHSAVAPPTTPPIATFRIENRESP